MFRLVCVNSLIILFLQMWLGQIHFYSKLWYSCSSLFILQKFLGLFLINQIGVRSFRMLTFSLINQLLNLLRYDVIVALPHRLLKLRVSTTFLLIQLEQWHLINLTLLGRLLLPVDDTLVCAKKLQYTLFQLVNLINIASSTATFGLADLYISGVKKVFFLSFYIFISCLNAFVLMENFVKFNNC